MGVVVVSVHKRAMVMQCLFIDISSFGDRNESESANVIRFFVQSS